MLTHRARRDSSSNGSDRRATKVTRKKAQGRNREFRSNQLPFLVLEQGAQVRCWSQPMSSPDVGYYFFFFFLLVAQEFGCSGRRGKTGKAATALLFLAIAERGQGKKSKIQNRQHDESRRKKERNRSAAALVVIAALGTLSGRFTDERKPAKDKKHDGRIHFGRIRQPVALCMQRSADRERFGTTSNCKLPTKCDKREMRIFRLK